MRYPLFCLALLAAAACSGTGAGSNRADDRPAAAGRPTRIVLNTYQGVAGVFIMENLAGRDLTELRSAPLKPGHPPVAYVEDEVMDELLRIFRKLDYDEHAQARPPDPRKFGAVAELTLIRGSDRRTILKKQPTGRMLTRDEAASLKSYVECKRNFLAVYNTYRPEMQATTGGGAFGVKRADRDDG
jgi:hypothetical protein